MAIKTINVNGTDYPIEGTGGGGDSSFAVQAQTYSSTRYNEKGKLYIICDEGLLEDNDTIRFARYIGGKSGKSYGRPGHEDEETRYSYRGWIVPKVRGEEYLFWGIRLERIEDGKEYWEVVNEDGESILNDVEVTERESGGAASEHAYIGDYVSLERKCGVAVLRDGKQLTDYMHFRAHVNDDGSVSFGTW